MSKISRFSYILIAVAVAVLFIAAAAPLAPIYGGDSNWYIAIAEGHLNQVIQPFSGRVLHPFLAGWLSSFSSLNTTQSFLFLAIISLVFSLIVNSLIFKKTVRSPVFFVFLFFSPYFLSIFREFFLSDIFYVFLTSLFFLALFYEKEALALLMLFPLFLARESTILLGAILLLVGLWRSKKLLSVAAAIVIILSVFTASRFNSLGLPNAHELTGLPYLILKLPYNFLNNVLGIVPWSNTLPHCEPIFQYHLPALSFFGSIQSIGICGFNPLFPLATVTTLLTIFGIMPAVLIYLFSKRKIVFGKVPFWLAIALVYGVISYFMSAIATTGVGRLAGYGWPAFLLFTPIIFANSFKMEGEFLIKISFLQFFVAWLPFLILKIGGETIFFYLFIIFFAAVAYWLTFRILKSREMTEGEIGPIMVSNGQ